MIRKSTAFLLLFITLACISPFQAHGWKPILRISANPWAIDPWGDGAPENCFFHHSNAFTVYPSGEAALFSKGEFPGHRDPRFIGDFEGCSCSGESPGKTMTERICEIDEKRHCKQE